MIMVEIKIVLVMMIVIIKTNPENSWNGVSNKVRLVY